MKKITNCVFLFIFLVLNSCNINSTLPEKYEPPLEFLAEDINTSIIISDPAINNNSHKNNELLLLQLENRSEQKIIFPEGFNLEIYQKLGTKWVLIKSNLEQAQGDWILPTKKEWKVGLALDSIPYIPNLKRPTTIRVFAFGKTENTGEIVGAYIDLPLNP